MLSGAGFREGSGRVPEDFHRLGLGRGGEGHEGDAPRPRPGAGRLRRQDVLGVSSAPRRRPGRRAPRATAPPWSCARRLAALRAVRLVGDHGEAFAPAWPTACAPLRGRRGKVWIVQTTIFLAPESASASLPLLLPSLLVIVATTAAGALEVEERLLKLRVDHGAVRDHQHGVEDFFCAPRRAAPPGSAPSRRWSSSCPSPPSAERDTSRPPRP